MAALRDAAGGNVRFLTLERGARRLPRHQSADHVMIDANLMKRNTFLEVVACAAGMSDTPAWPAVAQPGRQMQTCEGTTGHGDVRILVAEDNEVNQKVIQRQLALLGYEADLAGDGKQALARWRDKGPYSLIITDLHMPEMDGYDLTRHIRADEGVLSSVPILALTANALKGEAERCLAAGMSAYLSKPVTLAALGEALEHWLGCVKHEVSCDEAVSQEAERAEPVLNLQVLKQLVGDDDAFARELLNDFREQLSAAAVGLQDALRRSDLETLAVAAHKFKSSARAVGAEVLGETFAQIERAALAPDKVALNGLMVAFEAEAQKAIAYIETLTVVTE